MSFKTKPLRKSQEQENLDHQRLKTLINSMADAVLAVDNDMIISTYNAAALNLLDLNTITLGEVLINVFKPLNDNNNEVNIERIIRSTNLPVSIRDYRLKYKDGSIINLYISVAPVRPGFDNQEKAGFVILLRDITREKSLENERDEFISVVSHELRTPIAVTEGNISNAEFITNKTGDLNKIKEALKEAHSQTLFLADMINDLATLSRAERGRLTVENELINVADLINELTDNYLPQAKQKGLLLKTELDPSLKRLSSSGLYVKEILQNLITNAIKYTNEGQIIVSASQQNNKVKFSVIDSGIGISKSDQNKVFEKFFRSEDYRTRATKGTGLGLYVSMKLAQLIKAKLELSSELNKGSTFSITVPNLS